MAARRSSRLRRRTASEGRPIRAASSEAGTPRARLRASTASSERPRRVATSRRVTPAPYKRARSASSSFLHRLGIRSGRRVRLPLERPSFFRTLDLVACRLERPGPLGWRPAVSLADDGDGIEPGGRTNVAYLGEDEQLLAHGGQAGRVARSTDTELEYVHERTSLIA